MYEFSVGDTVRKFDLDNPQLPDWVKDNAFSSGGYVYDKKLKRSDYDEQLYRLHLELVTLQAHLEDSGERVMVVFEGRDAAGKGGTINAFRSYLNPRHTRTVALTKPTETEQGQWYYQRYADHFPTKGEIVLFDRSWYNRAGVEPVMGFCSPEQNEQFLAQTPAFEKMITDDGISFFKIWLNVGQEMEIKRFHDRRHDPLKSWKLSPIDLKALSKWDDYTKARDDMLAATHTDFAPWTIVRSNDKRRARINALRHILHGLSYKGKDAKAIGEKDSKIIGQGPEFLNSFGA